jgi:hypothetical protein
VPPIFEAPHCCQDYLLLNVAHYIVIFPLRNYLLRLISGEHLEVNNNIGSIPGSTRHKGPQFDSPLVQLPLHVYRMFQNLPL